MDAIVSNQLISLTSREIKEKLTQEQIELCFQSINFPNE
jgi:hypothetical protein